MAHSLMEMSEKEIHEFIDRCEAAITHDESLSSHDAKILLEIAKGYFHIQERLANKDLTLARLRKLLGMERSTERHRDLYGPQDKDAASKDDLANTNDTGAGADTSSNTPGSTAHPPGHGKSGVKDYEKADVVVHDHTDLKSGDSCPTCGKGKVYKFRPGQFIRITGQVPLKATVHIIKQLRCNMCGDVFKAPLPDDVVADGEAGQRFGYSASALIAIMKYAAGTPFYRQQTLERMMGVNLDASTLWDQCERLADVVKPIFMHMLMLAADARTYNADDTTARILSQEPVIKIKRGREQERSGVHTSGVLCELPTGQKVSLYKTGINHSGEFMDELLRQRTVNESFVYMSDGLSANNITMKDLSYVQAHCNAHARRQFVDLKEKFPSEAKQVLDLYALVYQNEKHVKKGGMTPDVRLAYHAEHSLPVMNDLFTYLKSLQTSFNAEPNGPLGGAISYFLKREDSLKAFCTTMHAPLDNNAEERELKRAVLQRKNSLFFKEKIGAAVSDILMSLCQTAYHADVNAHHYLTTLQRHRDLVKQSPDKFLPWTYQATISEFQ